MVISLSYDAVSGSWEFPTSVIVDDDFPRLLHTVAVRVLLGMEIRLHQLIQKADVADGQSQRIHLRQSLLVRKCRNVSAQAFKRVVDRQHPLPFPLVGGLALMSRLFRSALLLSPNLSASWMISGVAVPVGGGGGQVIASDPGTVPAAVAMATAAVIVLGVVFGEEGIPAG